MGLRHYTFTFPAMACENTLSFYAKNKKAARSVADAAIQRVNLLEQRYSRYIPDSLLSQINRSAGDPSGVDVDEETAGLLDYSQACYEQSDGLFDITSGVLRNLWNFKDNSLPDQSEVEETLTLIGWNKLRWDKPRIILPIAGMELDFGGVVKEYAADTCATLCREQGVRHGMVNMGGDIHVIGPHPDGAPWIIGIQRPENPEEIATTVKLRQGGLASSGDYQRFIEIGGQRYSHILDPTTGWPVRGLRAVTVVAPHCLIAGSTSTIAMLKGERGKKWLRATRLPYLWFDEGGQLYTYTDENHGTIQISARPGRPDSTGLQELNTL